MESGLKLDLGEEAVGMSFRDVDRVVVPEGFSLVMPCQTHTSNVGIVIDPGQVFPDTDALVTQLPGVAIGVRTADCVPILMNAPDIGAVAAIHAGWKGTVGNIVGNTVDYLVALGTDVGNIKVAFGPSICGECYETGRELVEKFKETGLEDAIIYGVGADPLGEKTFDEASVRIDLQKADTILLLRSGILPENIAHCKECTRHSERQWPSWRRENGTASRLVTIVHRK